MFLELSVCLVYVHTQSAGKSAARQTHTDDPWVLNALVRVSTTKEEIYSISYSTTDQELHSTLCHTLQSKGHV